MNKKKDKQKQRRKKNINKINNKFKSQNELMIDIMSIEEKNQQNFWMLSIISIISAFSSFMGFYNGFEIKNSLWILIMVSVIVFSLMTQILLINSKLSKIGFPLVIVAIGVYVVVTSKWIINGFTLIINYIIGYVNEHKAEMHIKYVATHNSEMLDIAIATVAICAVYTIVFNVFLKYKRIFLCAILLLASTMTNMLVGGEDQFLWVAISLICVFVIFYISNIRIFKIRKNISFSGIVLIFLILITTIFVTFVNYTKVDSIDELKEEIIYQAGNVVYGKSDYPEGQFKRFDEYPYESEEVRLKVSMTTPVPLHLKGYVGCQYTKKGWKDNDANIYGGNNLGMFEWFLEQGYYPLTQTAYYMGYSRNDGRNINFEKIENSTIHIVNSSASKKYEYISENLLDMSGLIDPKQDVNFKETDIFTEKEYWYDILHFTEDNYLKFPEQEWFNNSENALAEQKQFIQAENYYHGFVSKYYLEIPDEEKQILQNNVPICSNNVYDAVWTTRNYLKNQITYSDDVEEYDLNNNYLEQVLLKDRKGYSAHFATVATLMLRYYGVPARYVEGYWIPNEDEKETVEVKSTDAHAWVEIYIKGLGFVPVEVTPGFYEEEEVNGNITHKKHNPNNQGSTGTTGTKNEEDQHIQITWKMIFNVLLIVLGLFIVVTIIALIIRREIIVINRKKKLASLNNYLVVATASKYIDDVCIFNGSTINKEVPDQIRQILERVKFSKHPLLEKEEECVCQYMNEKVDEIWKKQTLRRKIVMMFWKGLK